MSDIYGRAPFATTFHRLTQDGKPLCGNKRLSGKPIIDRMSRKALDQYGFVSFCKPCEKRAARD